MIPCFFSCMPPWMMLRHPRTVSTEPCSYSSLPRQVCTFHTGHGLLHCVPTGLLCFAFSFCFCPGICHVPPSSITRFDGGDLLCRAATWVSQAQYVRSGASFPERTPTMGLSLLEKTMWCRSHYQWVLCTTCSAHALICARRRHDMCSRQKLKNEDKDSRSCTGFCLTEQGHWYPLSSSHRRLIHSSHWLPTLGKHSATRPASSLAALSSLHQSCRG